LALIFFGFISDDPLYPRHPRSIDTHLLQTPRAGQQSTTDKIGRMRRSAGSVSDLSLDQEANWSMPRFLTLPVLRRRSKAERR